MNSRPEHTIDLNNPMGRAGAAPLRPLLVIPAAAKQVQAAQQNLNIPMAQAEALLTGIGAPLNVNQGLLQLKQLGTQGYAPAYTRLGLHFKQQSKKPATTAIQKNLDEVQAFNYFNLAAYATHPDVTGQIELIKCYMKGRGTDQDGDLAYVTAQVAAASGHPDAIYYEARCHEAGFGTNKDAKAAFECFKKGAESKHSSPGNGNCQANLAQCYQVTDGSFGAKHDMGLAILHYQRAAELNNPIGLFYLGQLLMEGAPGYLESNLALAANHFERCKNNPAVGNQAEAHLKMLYQLDPNLRNLQATAVVATTPAATTTTAPAKKIDEPTPAAIIVTDSKHMESVRENHAQAEARKQWEAFDKLHAEMMMNIKNNQAPGLPPAIPKAPKPGSLEFDDLAKAENEQKRIEEYAAKEAADFLAALKRIDEEEALQPTVSTTSTRDSKDQDAKSTKGAGFFDVHGMGAAKNKNNVGSNAAVASATTASNPYPAAGPTTLPHRAIVVNTPQPAQDDFEAEMAAALAASEIAFALLQSEQAAAPIPKK